MEKVVGVPRVIRSVKPSSTYIMPSVAINAGTFRNVMTQPENEPITAPPRIATSRATHVGQP